MKLFYGTQLDKSFWTENPVEETEYAAAWLASYRFSVPVIAVCYPLRVM